MDAADPTIAAALRWRCRRGMRELDVLLGRWLEHRWPEAETDLQLAFGLLLGQEDDQIWDWMMGRADPPTELRAVVDDIRERSVPTAKF